MQDEEAELEEGGLDPVNSMRQVRQVVDIWPVQKNRLMMMNSSRIPQEPQRANKKTTLLLTSQAKKKAPQVITGSR